VASIDDVVLRLATAMRLHLRWASLNRKWCAFMARIPNAAAVGAVAQHHLVRDLIQGRKSAAFEFPSVDAALDLAVVGRRWPSGGWPLRRARRNMPMTSYEWCCRASGSSGIKFGSPEDCATCPARTDHVAFAVQRGARST